MDSSFREPSDGQIHGLVNSMDEMPIVCRSSGIDEGKSDGIVGKAIE